MWEKRIKAEPLGRKERVVQKRGGAGFVSHKKRRKRKRAPGGDPR